MSWIPLIRPGRLPLRWRVTAVAVVVEAVILAGLGAFLVLRLRHELVVGLDSALASRAAQLVQTDGEEANFSDAGDLVLPGRGRVPAGLAQIIGRRGEVLQSAGEPVTERPLLSAEQLRRARLNGLRLSTNVAGVGQARLLALPAGDGSVLVVAGSLDGVTDATGRLLLLLVVGGLGALAVSALGAWWLAGRALRPIDLLSASAAGIGADDLTERLPVPATGDEVARLATVLNGLLARVDRAVEDQRTFVADASHELRTPVALLRAELDVALRSPETLPAARETLESVREEADRLAHLSENLLTLARSDAGRLELAHEAVGLEDVAERALRLLHAAAERKGARLDRALAPAPVWGDPDRLTQVAINLLDNAVRHAPPGSRVLVETSRAGSDAVLAVTDEGDGVPAALVPVLFERFTKADPARPRADAGGAGLGLAIARTIAAAHRGRLELEWTGPDGSRFVLRVPGRPTPDPPGARGPSSFV